MKIFEIIGGVIRDTAKADGFHNCKILAGGYSSDSGHYAEIQAIGQEDKLRFKINDQVVYNKILEAYLRKEAIGVILL